MYTKNDIGCYIDGCYGLKHQRLKLIEIMEDIKEKTLAQELNSYKDDVCYDEILNDCIIKLQENTKEGLIWAWDGGDLILTLEDNI